MKIHFMVVLGLVLFSCRTPGTVLDDDGLYAIVGKSGSFQGSLWSYSAGFVEEEVPFYSQNGDSRLSFGSCQKLLTTAAAFDYLGPTWNWETKAFLVPSKNNFCDLLIQGNGDPTIASKDFYADPLEIVKSLVSALTEKGVTSIHDLILPDMGFHMDPKDLSAWADLGSYDSRPGAALNWSDNLMFIKLNRQPGAISATFVGSVPFLPAVHFDLSALSKDPGKELTARGLAYPGTRTIRFIGMVPDDGQDHVIQTVFPDPLYSVGVSLRLGLQNAGISVTGLIQTPTGRNDPTVAATPFWIWKSAPLKDVLFIQNKKSSNFIADQTGRALAYSFGLPASLENAALQVLSILGEWDLPVDVVTIYDPTGICRQNGLSSDFMFELLCKASKKIWFQDFLRTLPAPGPQEKISPLHDFFKGTGLEGKVFLKSGTLMDVRAFCGYLKTNSGKLIAFSFCVNNYKGSKKQVDSVFREWLIQLNATMKIP